MHSAAADRTFTVQELDDTESSDTQGRYSVWSDSQYLGTVSNDHQLHEMMEPLIRLFVAQYAPDHVFVHAGVVGWKGTALVVPGYSYSGKTTLVVELIQRGATYYSDEYAVLDEQGRVHSFAKPLSIRQKGGYEQRDQSVEELGGQVGSKPLDVGIILACHYQSGTRWRPRQLSAGEGALELMTHTASTRRQPERVLNVLGKVAAGAIVLKGARGESHELLDEILNIKQNTT